MKRCLFSVYDLKAAAYNAPFMQPTHGCAERQFLDWAQQAGSSIQAHPEDYTLMHVGDFDELTGQLVAPKNGPQPVCNAQILLAQSGSTRPAAEREDERGRGPRRFESPRDGGGDADRR